MHLLYMGMVTIMCVPTRKRRYCCTSLTRSDMYMCVPVSVQLPAVHGDGDHCDERLPHAQVRPDWGAGAAGHHQQGIVAATAAAVRTSSRSCSRNRVCVECWRCWSSPASSSSSSSGGGGIRTSFKCGTAGCHQQREACASGGSSISSNSGSV